MDCPTCSHTMHVVVPDSVGMRHSLCPRCGTHAVDKIVPPAGPGGEPSFKRISTWTPELVRRCREFEAAIGDFSFNSTAMGNVVVWWRSLGVAESINRPEDR